MGESTVTRGSPRFINNPSETNLLADSRNTNSPLPLPIHRLSLSPPASLSLSLCVCLLSCSKYRPQSSEPQTDGLSVSTTADGSQPNVRKLCDTPPPAPQAHTHNLAYYDNIICQVRPTLSFFSPPIQQSFILYLSASEISSHFTFSSYPLCSCPLPCFLSTSLIGFFSLPVSTHARLSEC